MQKGDWFSLGSIVVIIALVAMFFFLVPKSPKPGYGLVELPGSTLTVAPNMSWATMQMFNMTLVQDGFITIHESLGGAPGPVVASRYVDGIGLHEGVGVSLETPLLHGVNYIALLHVDNGDHVYVPEDDLPVSVNGIPVRADFQSDVPVEEVTP